MAVYSTFGCLLTPLADCGEHALAEFPRPVRIIRARYADDGGFAALEAALGEIPQATLAGPELAAAIEEAR